MLDELRAKILPKRGRDQAVADAIIEGQSHIRANQQLLRELRAVQAQLERSSPPPQGTRRWTRSSP